MNSWTSTAMTTIGALALLGAPNAVGTTATPRAIYDTSQPNGSAALKESDGLQASSENWPGAVSRLVTLSELKDDHDGEGAIRPDPRAIEAAISFVRSLPFYAPEPIVGVTHDGAAVVEFVDDDEFGQLMFRDATHAEAFFQSLAKGAKSFEGDIRTEAFSNQFVESFGFRV